MAVQFLSNRSGAERKYERSYKIDVKYWIQKITETKRTSLKVTTTEKVIVLEKLENEFKEHNITGTFAQFAI